MSNMFYFYQALYDRLYCDSHKRNIHKQQTFYNHPDIKRESSHIATNKANHPYLFIVISLHSVLDKAFSKSIAPGTILIT